MPNQINPKKVAKNTLMLYLRMGVMMIVSLYTSRVILATLGIEDFGIYNVVGGVIVMFSFMNLTLTIAIRRFLAFELGQEEKGRIQEVFIASIIAVFLASLIIIVGLESLGYWFLNNKLNIPPERLVAANIVYQFSIVSFFFNINLIPYSSAIVAYEEMGVFAYLGIAETMLKLGVVILLLYLPGDNLVWFGFLVAIMSVFISLCNYLYCNYKVIRIKSLLSFNWLDVLSIFKFTGWTILGTFVFMLATQGVNMIFNIFFGVAINAALGIAQQVANATNQFVGNFQTAFNPQLTKSFSSEGLSKRTFFFVCQTSRLSFMLILVICIPIIVNAAPILDIWLDKVPEYAVAFTIIFVVYTAIDGAAGPLYYLVYAKGELKQYQLVLSIIQIMYVLAIYFLCLIGMTPAYVLSINVVTVSIMYAARLLLLKKILGFPVKDYIKMVLIPLIIPILIFGCVSCILNKILLDDTIVLVLMKILIMIAVVSIVGFYIYLNNDERLFVYSLVKK
jgi:O-antigen/teichoic acid export membrane protein